MDGVFGRDNYDDYTYDVENVSGHMYLLRQLFA